MAKPEGGRFDEDTYERARKWREAQESKKDAPKPVAKAKPAAKPAAEMPKAGTGSGRGGMGGPTADELDAYAKKRADDKFEQSIKDNLVTSERDEMNKYRDRAIGAGTAAASLIPAGRMLASAGKPSAATSRAALKELSSGGVKADKVLYPLRPRGPINKRTGVDKQMAKSEEGFPPAESNRMHARNKAQELAKQNPSPASRSADIPPSKPVASASGKADKAERASRSRYPTNDKKPKVEMTKHAKGGLARAKTTKYC